MRSSRSRHLLGTAAGLLLAAGALTACQGSTPVATPGSAPAGDQPSATSSAATPSVATYFAQYGLSGHAYKPRRLNPSADGSLFLTDVRWTLWDNRRAVGAGIAHVNDCTPDCADGHYATHAVTVLLSQPRKQCGSRFFMTFRLTGRTYHTYAHWHGVVCQ